MERKGDRDERKNKEGRRVEVNKEQVKARKPRMLSEATFPTVESKKDFQNFLQNSFVPRVLKFSRFESEPLHLPPSAPCIAPHGQVVTAAPAIGPHYVKNRLGSQ